MRKNILFTAFLLFLTIVSTQASIKWGVKGGVNLSKASFSWNALDPDNFTGYQVGPIAEFKLPIIGIGMDAAVLYSLQGFKIENQTKEYSSLEIPLNIKYKFNLLGAMGAYGTAGAYASFNLTDDGFTLDGIPDQFEKKTFGGGLNFGFGIELFSHLQIGANYQMELTDNYSTQEYSIKNKTWSVTAAFFF